MPELQYDVKATIGNSNPNTVNITTKDNVTYNSNERGLEKVSVLLNNVELSSITFNVNANTIDRIYVSSTGSDTAIGDRNNPLKTIEAAIKRNNENGGDKVIILLPGTYSEDNLEINDIVTIIGETEDTIINGDNNPVFIINNDTQLYNLTLTNSKSAIYHNNGYLSIFTCGFENNQIALTSISSNLILSDTQFNNNNESIITNSDTIINNCEFNNNVNGIMILKSANITNSSFNNNERGIYVNNTEYTVLINNNTFKSNTAPSGSAIYVNKSGVIISNNIFTENGGAIYINQISDDNILNNVFNNDTVYLKDANVNLKNNTNTSIFSQNSCISNIILKFLNNETVKVKSGEIELNASVCDDMGNTITGGTVTFTIDGATIDDADVLNGSATIKTNVSDGEYIISGSYTDSDNSISINDGFLRVNIKNYWFINETGYETIIDAVADAGINDVIKGIPGTYFQEQVQIGHRTRPDEPWVINKNITITSLTDEPIIFNATGRNIFNIDYYSNVTFINILFTGANNPEGWGGAIHSMGKNTISITNCTFIDNYAEDGAAIHSWGNLYVTDCNFINNEARVYGGAIFKDGDGDFIIENSRFINNTAYTYAGAVYTMGYSEVIQIFRNITFDGNDATCGGAVFTQGKNVTFIDCNFTNNKALDKDSGYNPLGGALYTHYGASRFVNVNFINNYAEGNGGALELDNSVLSTLDSEGRHLSIYWATFDNCTIENNTASGYGTIFSGGSFTVKNYVNITNTVIKNNKAGDATLFVNLYGFYTLNNVTAENNTNTNGNTLIYTYGVYSYPESFYANTTIINSRFINNKDEIIINTTTEYSTVRITDSTFENEGIILFSEESVAYLTNVSEINPTNNYSIKNYGELSLENNTFINPIYNNGNITTATYVIAINNSTIIEESGKTIQIESLVTDDNNNSIIGGSMVFIINNTQIPAVLETDHYIGNYTVLEGNQSVISVYDDFGLLNLTVKNGIIIGRLIILLNVTTRNITVGENAIFTVTLPSDATGNITLYINNGTYNATLENGTAVISIPDLEFGNYNANITYFGDDKYNQTKTNASIRVIKAESYIIINANNILINDVAIINITVPEDATGDVILTINNKDYYSNIINGKGSIEIENLKAGTYNVEAAYNGNAKYLISTNSTSFSVNKKEVNINCISNRTLLTITVDKEDATGNITVISGSKNYTGVLENSAVIISIDEEPGNHEITIKYSGDDRYNSSKITANITIENITDTPIENTTTDNSTNTTENTTVPKDNTTVKANTIINVENLEFYYQDDGKYIIKLTDENSNPIADQNIIIFINGVNINRTTDNNGIVSLDIGLKPKLYPVTVSYNGNSKYNSCENMNNISVLSKIRLDKNKDIVKDYLDSTKYKIRVLDKYGKAVGAGEIVKITINKKTYTVKTKSNGYVSLDIKLKPKTYTITVEYGNYSVKNKIVVKQVLKAKNTSKKKAKKVTYKATLKTSKGKAIKNKKITFRINGKNYSAKTNKKGVATVQFKNLKVAKYIVKITYEKTSIKKTLKIKK